MEVKVAQRRVARAFEAQEDARLGACPHQARACFARAVANQLQVTTRRHNEGVSDLICANWQVNDGPRGFLASGGIDGLLDGVGACTGSYFEDSPRPARRRFRKPGQVT